MKSFTSFILCCTLALCTILGVMMCFGERTVAIGDPVANYTVTTNEPFQYIVQCRYTGAYQKLGDNIFGTPKFYNNPRNHSTLHNAQRFTAKQLKYLIAPKDYKLYNDKIFFRVRKVGDEYCLKEVSLEEME